MNFLSVSKKDKLASLEIAKQEVTKSIYRLLIIIGEDPDTYNLNDFIFDSSSARDEDLNYDNKRYLQSDIEKLSLINSKISELLP